MSVNGLVVCGGKSTRMGTDKSTLNYHGKPQRYHLYEMLETLCEQVFISCNREQVSGIPDKYSVVVDAQEYEDIGPMAALLTAFKQHPEATFLVVGCDYPLLKQEHLQRLLEVSLQTKKTVAFYRKDSEIYEPLIAVYQSDVYRVLQENFKLSNYSLQAVLRALNANLIELEEHMGITSIDTEENYLEVMAQLRSKEKDNV